MTIATKGGKRRTKTATDRAKGPPRSRRVSVVSPAAETAATVPESRRPKRETKAAGSETPTPDPAENGSSGETPPAGKFNLDTEYDRALKAFRLKELEAKSRELDRKLARELDELGGREPEAGRGERPGVGWWPTADVCDMLGGISNGAFLKSWKPLLREEDPSEVRPGGGAKPTYYHTRRLMEAYRERAVREAVSAALAGRNGGDVAEALLAGGGDSPALERLRLAQAQLKEHELARLRDEYIARDELYESLRVSAGIIQQFVEEARKAYPGIAGLAEKMVERWKKENARRFGEKEE